MKEQTPTDADLPVGGFRFSRRTLLGGMALGVAAAAAPTLVHPGAAAAAPPYLSFIAPKVDYSFRDDTVPADKRLDDIMNQLTLEEKIAMATGGASAAVPRLGINAGRRGGGEGVA